MANELKHGSVGTELSQAEWEAVGAHVFDSQATGDIAYASTATQLRRLAKGTDGDTLTLASDIPAWNTATQNDVTGSRAIDATVYQNTTGRPLLVSVNIRANVDDDGGGSVSGASQVTIHSDAATPPTAQIIRIGLQTSLDGIGAGASDYVDGDFQAMFLVLPSNYYKATASNSGSAAAPTLVDWFEWEI